MAENDAGNTAAMRAALEKIKKLNRYDLGCIKSRKRREEFDAKILEIERVVRIALAAPARNCDVGTLEEQSKRFSKFCESHPYKDGVGSRCDNCELDVNNCEIAWTQMPYKEGGDKR